jgi:hypothetical protein
MALHLENELLMISVLPESLSKQAAAWFYQLRNLTGWDDLVRVFLERYRFNPHLASVVCVPLSLFRCEIRVVCVWELVYVCACEHQFGVATNHGKFKV